MLMNGHYRAETGEESGEGREVGWSGKGVEKSWAEWAQRERW